MAGAGPLVGGTGLGAARLAEEEAPGVDLGCDNVRINAGPGSQRRMRDQFRMNYITIGQEQKDIPSKP